MSNHFENNWKEFTKGNLSERPPEDLDRYELARMFYELGFSKGVLQ